MKHTVKSILALAIASGLTTIDGNAKAAIVSINPKNSFSVGLPQAFSFDGTTLSYSYTELGCFMIQAIDPDGEGSKTLLGSWNTDNFSITAVPIAFNSSVKVANPQTLQLSWLAGPVVDVYYGLSFMISTGNYDYGWLKVSYNPVEGAALSSVAFNTTPNEDINAGQMSAVPEPSEWAALSFGVLGVVWVAKRRFMPARV